MTPSTAAAPAPGMHMLDEIREQPERVREALTAALPRLAGVRRAILEAPFVALLGRGSSRSAATYGAVAFRAISARPAFLLSPAELGWGEPELPLEGAVVLAISQSGRSRELLAAAERARAAGARLVVVTNTLDSELAGLAERPEHVFPCCAGPELAVPATKSFTTSIACLLAIAAASRPDLVERARDEVPELIAKVVEDLGPAGLELADSGQFVLAGEGYGEGIAEEGAIKLRETLSRSVASFETSEFLHGSVNSSGPGTAIFTIGTDPVGQALAVDVSRAAAERGATVIHVGHEPVAGASAWLRIPSAPPAWAAFAAIVPIQLAARSSALALGFDPDRPAGLSKITLIGDGKPSPPVTGRS